ncbi:MAG: hypothetical protein ACRCWG_03015 [Sarcina sp.]
MEKIKNVFCNYLEDFLIIIGLIIISTMTLLFSIWLGMYVIGVIFIILGIYFARNPLNRRE